MNNFDKCQGRVLFPTSSEEQGFGEINKKLSLLCSGYKIAKRGIQKQQDKVLFCSYFPLENVKDLNFPFTLSVKTE